jgi:hypothetical protein
MPALQKNTLVPQVDLPMWEWTRFAPAASSAISESCSADCGLFKQDEHGRYIYYLISATQFVRYDTITDMYQFLTPPPIAPLSFSELLFLGAGGFEGNVLGATSTTLTVPAVSMQSLLGFDVVITSGTGAGQRRTIVGVAEPVVADSGIVTAVNNVAGAITATDSLKAWTPNQHAGFSFRVTGNSGVGQIRRILSNSATVLNLGDSTQVNKQWSNPAIFSPTISAAAGAQSTYAIESQVITLDSAWGITPDTTSEFIVQSGRVALISSAAATPFYTIQIYNIITDTWFILPAYTNLLAAAGTDLTVARCSENGSIWERGIATGGTTTTLVDSSRGESIISWQVNQWAGYWVYIYSGMGAGQIRQVASNTGNTLTWASAGTAPDATSRYIILGFDAGIATAGSSNTITDSTKSWAVDRWTNYAVEILAGTGAGQERIISSNSATALTIIGTWATNPDATSVFVIQGDSDKFYLMPGGIAAVPIVNLDASVTSFGRQQDFGIARNAAITVAGHQPVAIASFSNVGTTATVNTVHPHQFKVGNLATVRGANEANFNVTNVVIASVPSPTSVTYVMAGTPASVTIPGTQTTSTLTDLTKNWTVNQWAGFTVYMSTTAVTAASGAVTGQFMRVASNTATTLTFASAGTAPTNGVTRYAICTSSAVGAADFGVATGTHSTTTLQDTTKTWAVNIWAGKRIRFLTVGGPVEIPIVSNTSNTLTFGSTNIPTNLATGYVILEQSVRGLGTNAVWVYGNTNPSTKGRYFFNSRGGGLAGFDRLDLTTDRFNLIFTSPTSETLTTGSMLAYDGDDHVYFHKDATQRIYQFNVNTAKITGGSIYPYAAPTAILGNRMEIFSTKDNLKYMWINRASFAECFRCLLFW